MGTRKWQPSPPPRALEIVGPPGATPSTVCKPRPIRPALWIRESAGMERTGFFLLQSLPPEKAREQLLRCCHCGAWADGVIELFPLRSEEELRDALDDVWLALGPKEWVEAMEAHPRIGDKNPGGAGEKRSGWEADEQSGTSTASEDTMSELARLNDEYHSKFGFVFLICATGKTAGEMLEALKERLPNDRSTEIRTAAEEQRKITHLRFTKLLDGLESGGGARL